MKYFTIIFLVFLLPVSMALAQNQLPKISNVKVQLDKENRKVRIQFDLSDEEESSLAVHLRVSDDSAERFLVDTENATGDVGAAVSVGNAKEIVWEYDTALQIDKAQFRIIADDGYKIPMTEILAKVDANRIRNNLEKISVARNHKTEEGKKNLAIIRDLIEQSFQQTGCQTRRQIFPFGGWTGENVIGRKAGTIEGDTNLLVMGEFDSMESRTMSAINSNGMVGVLEVMNVLGEYQFKKTILGAGFDLIYPEHMGANFFIWKEGGFPKDEKIEGGFYLDGIASDTYRATDLPKDYHPEMSADWVRKNYNGTFMLAFANDNSVPLLKSFRQQVAANTPDTRYADRIVGRYGEDAYQAQAGAHAPFWYRDLQAVYVTTWMAIRRIKPNKKWSITESALKMSSIESMTEIIKAVVATMVEKAEIQHCAIYEAVLKQDAGIRAAVD